VVCDGYGYNLNTLYHHLNMGWSGNSNVWYALPVIDSSAGTFTSVYKCIYNVFQTGTGEILSGRIIDSNNQPVAGATVSAALPDGSQFTATSNSRGIYSMAKIPSSTSLTVQATKADYTSATRTVTTGKSSDYAAQSGNAWGVDLTLAAKLSYPITLSVYPSSGGVIAGSGTFSEGASTQISATANPGWIFAGWNDGNTQNPRPITVPSGGATYTANFAVASSFSLSTPGSGVAAFPAAFSWSYQGGAPGLQMFISNTPNFANYFAQSFSATGTNAYFVIGADEWRRILGITGSSSTYYWTLGIVDGGGNALAFADWSAFTPQIPTVAKMLAPSDGSAFSSNVVTFTWNAALEASQYALWVGSEPDTYDLYAGWEGTGLSRTLTLPSDGRTLHVKLWSCVGGEWKSSNSTYTSYSAPGFAMPAMTAPLAGSVLPSSTVTFQWSAGSSATQFSLWAGSTPGSYNLYAGWEGANKSKTLSLPDNGSPIYIRLWALINGTYLYEDYAYTAHGGSGITKAAMTSPANGTTLASPSVTFAWTASPSASQYALWVGSSPGTYDLHASWAGSGTTKTLTFPADGRALYVRLWSVINGTAYYNDYTYTASDQRAKLLSPAAGSALTSSPTTFTWDAGSGATQYKLWIGNAPGNNDVYASAASATPFATAVLPVDGRPLYVRLWSSINGTWFFNSYTFTARDACAQMLQPAPGAALPASTATFTWGGGSGASQYALWVGSEPHTYNLNASWEGSNTSKTLSLPADGSPLYITLWSQINGVFYSKEFTYWAFDNKARMLAPATGSTLASPTVTFAWDAGKGVQGYALWVGSAPDAADLFSANMGSALSQTLTLPADGRSLYVKLWSFVDGVWKANSYSYVAPGTGNP